MGLVVDCPVGQMGLCRGCFGCCTHLPRGRRWNAWQMILSVTVEFVQVAGICMVLGRLRVLEGHLVLVVKLFGMLCMLLDVIGKLVLL